MSIRTEASPLYEIPEIEPWPQDLCGEPKYFAVEDDLLELCYELNLACGVSRDEGVERFRRSLWNTEAYPSRSHGTQHPAPCDSDSEGGFWKGLEEYFQTSEGRLHFLLQGVIY